MPRHPLSTTLRIKKLYKDAKAPERKSDEAAGWDLYAYLPDGKIGISPHERKLVGCGFAMQIDSGYEAQVRPRSGMATQHGITVANAPGTIDSDYRGEVKVCLYNMGTTTFILEPDTRIAQMVISALPRVSMVELKEDEELEGTERGAGGFGSTGSS